MGWRKRERYGKGRGRYGRGNGKVGVKCIYSSRGDATGIKNCISKK